MGERERERDRQTDRQTETETDRQRQTQRDTQRETETDGQRDRVGNWILTFCQQHRITYGEERDDDDYTLLHKDSDISRDTESVKKSSLIIRF